MWIVASDVQDVGLVSAAHNPADRAGHEMEIEDEV